MLICCNLPDFVILLLDNMYRRFVKMKFGKKLNSSNTWQNLGNLSGLDKVTMYGYGGNILSSPGSISSGTNFTCTFKDYS